ncbi:MAG: hypothetical protein LGR52_15485 [Candidatus Thiosymbion ectosymbiont of Robbea hypermnestra]|nr:hypothetical protein [Candidatus Thiosymbion ectosymbiont of Robbea hypermnestra]
MKRFKGALLLLVIGWMGGFTAVYAGDIRVSPGRVIDVVTADWNGDHTKDRALLLETDTENGIDLLIYLSTAEGERTLSVHVKDLAWQGRLAGTRAAIQLNKRGSILIESGNQAIGRNRWRHRLTIAYRDNRFIVAGFTSHSFDTLDPEATVSCDLNYLTGTAIRNDQPLRIKTPAPPLTAWNADSFPEICN